MYKIGIVGHGIVGQGIHRLFKDQVKAVYDPYKSKSDVELFGQVKLNNKKAFADMDLIVVCVMTAEKEDGSSDTSLVEESLKWIGNLATPKKYPLVLVKSAIIPSKIDQLECYSVRLVVSPEYMGESRYFTPFWKYPDPGLMERHDFQVFGGSRTNVSECIDIFMRVMGPHVKFHQTDATTAALCKYMENSFFATKVTFCNEWYDIARVHGVDYNELRELWLADSRVCPMHTAVFPKDRGYGGKCYPKDVRAIIKSSEKRGFEPELMKSVNKVNNKLRI